MANKTSPTLLAALEHIPQRLTFGTSGRRGKITDLTQLEVYINAFAELEYLQQLPTAHGGIRKGDDFYFAYDLRPSSTHFVPEHGGYGEIAQAIERAISDAGMLPVNLGPIPTPALTAYALARGKGSMMITGSHIPFDRNGFKTNSAVGELLKADEAPIADHVERWRAQLYATPYCDSIFNAQGIFKRGSSACSAIEQAGATEYMDRYIKFFGQGALRGSRILVYQHSAVGRDLLANTLDTLGAETRTFGRSHEFIPIDTEAVDNVTLEAIRDQAEQAHEEGERFDVIVSTDGDSDRPMIIGLEYDAAGRSTARFYGGDLIGMLVAEYLEADAVVVPISCNDAIDRGPLRFVLEPKTAIGSPYVIAGMLKARERGAKRVCGWEANGGFLTGSAIQLDGRELAALPTRDAFLPIISVLRLMRLQTANLSALFNRLPHRFSRAGLLRQFPRHRSRLMIAHLLQVLGNNLSVPSSRFKDLIEAHFTPALGFTGLERVDTTDGVRLYFSNGDVAHIRPSGNADELRIYAVSDSQERADDIVAAAVTEPEGILARLANLSASEDVIGASALEP